MVAPISATKEAKHIAILQWQLASLVVRAPENADVPRTVGEAARARSALFSVTCTAWKPIDYGDMCFD